MPFVFLLKVGISKDLDNTCSPVAIHFIPSLANMPKTSCETAPSAGHIPIGLCPKSSSAKSNPFSTWIAASVGLLNLFFGNSAPISPTEAKFVSNIKGRIGCA